MLIIEGGIDEIIRVRADGQLSTTDYVDFVRRFEQIAGLNTHPIRMRVDLGANFGGWNLDTLFRDQAFALSSEPLIRRIAIVGDPRWQAWGSGPSYAALANAILFFPLEARTEALGWLCETGAGAAA